MSKIIDYMKELNLTSSENIRAYFTQNSIDTIQSFEVYMSDLAYEDWHIAEYSPYNFAPSMDLSGFGGCSALDCKIGRAFNFSRFASLYSDTVYLIVNSITNQNLLPVEEDETLYRENLINDYSLILIYSELIERNIVRIVPTNFNVCPDCFAKHILNTVELEKLEPVINEYSNKAVIKVMDYDKEMQMGGLEIQNLPELFPEHSGYIIINGGPCIEYLDKAKNLPDIIQNDKITEDIIKSFVYENYITSKYETLVSSLYQAKFVTTKPFDKTMIDLYSNQTIGTVPPPVFDMPFFANVDIQTILKLRENEYHLFNDYRIALDRAAKEYLKEPSQIRTIYDDVIYPAFTKLDGMFEHAKRTLSKKGVGSVAILASTVTWGLINSSNPTDLLGIVKSTCGTGVIMNNLVKLVESKIAADNELKKQDFYFLWQLKRKM